MTSNIIATKEQANVLFYLSWLSFVTGATGLYYGKPILGLLVWIGSIFAINYWKNPVYGWRRNIDMLWVQMLIYLHIYYVWNSQVRLTYFLIQLNGGCFYCISWYYHKRNYLWTSTLCHAVVNLSANGSLLVFYIWG
jgi:hypothetical protein